MFLHLLEGFLYSPRSCTSLLLFAAILSSHALREEGSADTVTFIPTSPRRGGFCLFPTLCMTPDTHVPWTMEEVPEAEYWGSIIRLRSTDDRTLRLRCSTASLRPHTQHNDAVVEVLLAGITTELTELRNTLPRTQEVTVDIHGRNSSPYVNELTQGIAFQYWLRVFDTREHLYLMTHEHWHDDRDTLQCIQGLRQACTRWMDTIEKHTAKTLRAAG